MEGRQRSGVGVVMELLYWLLVPLSQLCVTVTRARLPDVDGQTCTSEVSGKGRR